MRIKTFESVIPLSDLYALIKSLIGAQWEIVENSFVADSNLFIVGVDLQKETIIIRGLANKVTNRTYLSVIVLKTNEILKTLSLNESSKQSIKLIGNALYNFIKNREREGLINPFIGIGVKDNELRANNYDLIKIEKTIFNKILDIVGVNFGYSDPLMKFPFSINIEGAWELWEDIYSNLLTAIKNHLVTSKNTSIKTYEYYDFALTEELYQRIFDLIIAEEKVMTYSPVSVSTGIVPKKWDEQSQRRKEEKQQQKQVGLQKTTQKKIESDDEDKGTHYLWLSFVYTNRTLKPMSIIQVLKLIQEVKRFAQLFKQKNNSKYIEITPSIIFLSLFGYEQNIGKYLRENIFRDQGIIIPIFTVPPINKEIWHNLRAKNKILDADNNNKKKALQNISTIYNKMSGVSSIKKSQVDDAEKKFKQIEKSEKNAAEDNVFLQHWAELLNIKDSNELLDLTNNQNKIMKAVANFNEISKLK